MLQIGSRPLKTNIFLASLSGCADLAFRLIAREQGAEFCFYEMSDANTLTFTNRVRTADMHQVHPKDSPIAAQLLGTDTENMLKGARKILEMNPQIAFLDINAACPMRKVIKKKAGAYLIKEPDLLFGILKKLTANLSIPITVKLRTGYLQGEVERIVAIAKECEQNGAKALFVHGRTKSQEYSGEIDYAAIRQIKAGVKIPVFGSGNIFTPQKAKQMFEMTACDGILVARGAFGNPWIFSQIKAYLKDGELLPDPSFEEKMAVMKKHIQYLEKFKMTATKNKLGYARKVACWYLKKIENVSVLRKEIFRLQSFDELFRFIDAIITHPLPFIPSPSLNKRGRGETAEGGEVRVS